MPSSSRSRSFKPRRGRSRRFIARHMRRTVTGSSRGSTMSVAPTLRDEISMGTAGGISTRIGGVRERNGQTYQKIVSKARTRRFRVTQRDVNNLIAPVYKFRYDGYGWNNAFTDTSGEGAIPATPTYNASTGVTTYAYNNLYNPTGVWKSCEWAAGNQYWFETTALPFYKKIPNGSVRSLTELISKYADVSTNTAFTGNLDLKTYYKALDTALTEGGVNAANTLINAVNICYHGGSQKHTFTNFSTTSVTLELWELHPRRYMAGYSVAGQTAAATNIYKHEKIWEDVVRDIQDNAPTSNLLPPFDDKKAYDEIHDIGTRIDNDCRRIMFKYKCSKPMKVTISPGGTFTYEIKIPAFKVTGGEFLDYLTRYGSNFDQANTAASELREAMRPSWVPKFTRILCGRMWGQKGFGIGTSGKPDGNAADTSFINAVGFGAGRVGHTMSEYHAMNLMPYMKPSTYSRVNYLDTTGITQYIDGGDDEQFTWDDQAGNDLTATANVPVNHPNDDQ